eukprot:4332367-Prorocentrum_lima.AAC.1
MFIFSVITRSPPVRRAGRRINPKPAWQQCVPPFRRNPTAAHQPPSRLSLPCRRCGCLSLRVGKILEDIRCE